MARQSAVVSLSQYGQARWNASDVELIASFFHQDFGATRFRRRKENTVGRAGNIFLAAENADVRFDFVVVRSEIFVPDGPIITETIAGFRQKIDRSKT